MNWPAPKTVRRRFFVAFGRAIRLAWPVLSIILAIQIALGLLIGFVEGWSVGDAIYFTSVTCLLLPSRALHLDREQQTAAPDQSNELTPFYVEHGGLPPRCAISTADWPMGSVFRTPACRRAAGKSLGQT